jgi:hypothetical protein
MTHSKRPTSDGSKGTSLPRPSEAFSTISLTNDDRCYVRSVTRPNALRRKEIKMGTLLRVVVLALCAVGVWQSAIAQSSPTQDEMQALAPSGRLRAALYLGGPTNVVKEPSGEMKGVGYELGKELARRMGVAL